MEILFLGDMSNFYVSLATSLREAGHKCVIVSNGCGFLDTERDFDLARTPGIRGGVRYVGRLLKMLPHFRGFDIVHLNSTVFLELKPAKVRLVLDYLLRHNGKVFLTAGGTDTTYYDACHDGVTFKYSDYFVGDSPTAYSMTSEGKRDRDWTLPSMRRYNDYLLSRVHGVVACLYEYHKAYSHILPSNKVHYSGIPILTDSLTPELITTVPDKVRFFIGMYRNREVLKGTDRMLESLRRLHDRYPDKCEMVIADSVPYEEYKEMMRGSHVLLDQLYSYTPATSALMAMARGMVAVSGAEDEFYDFIGEKELRPIINVSPLEEGDIDRKLEWLITNRDLLPELSAQSRAFVEKHNAANVVASRHLKAWLDS